MSKPITLYSHEQGVYLVRCLCGLWTNTRVGPNPWKVAIILEELGLEYDTKFLDLQTEVKAKPFTDINPNGRFASLSHITC